MIDFTLESFPELAPERSRGHTWKRDSSGEIDIFAIESGFCNGPQCTTCGFGECWHCARPNWPSIDCTHPMPEDAKS